MADLITKCINTNLQKKMKSLAKFLCPPEDVECVYSQGVVWVSERANW